MVYLTHPLGLFKALRETAHIYDWKILLIVSLILFALAAPQA